MLSLQRLSWSWRTTQGWPNSLTSHNLRENKYPEPWKPPLRPEGLSPALAVHSWTPEWTIQEQKVTEGLGGIKASIRAGSHVCGATQARRIPKPKMQASGETSPVLLEFEESQIPRRANSYQ